MAGWAAVVGVGVFLGGAALFYTLLFGYAAFTLDAHGACVAAAVRDSAAGIRCCGWPSSA